MDGNFVAAPVEALRSEVSARLSVTLESDKHLRQRVRKELSVEEIERGLKIEVLLFCDLVFHRALSFLICLYRTMQS
jgi:hypothetical protein